MKATNEKTMETMHILAVIHGFHRQVNKSNASDIESGIKFRTFSASENYWEG